MSNWARGSLIVAAVLVAAVGLLTLFGDNVRRMFGMDSREHHAAMAEAEARHHARLRAQAAADAGR